MFQYGEDDLKSCRTLERAPRPGNSEKGWREGLGEVLDCVIILINRERGWQVGHHFYSLVPKPLTGISLGVCRGHLRGLLHFA